MIIKELNLIGFGKFKNKIVNFEDGLNILYGENEYGKTTLHNFIDGMFYGFLKPYAKSTIYLDEHSKYNPWNNYNYSGIIKFEHNHQIYNIERDFTKGKESTKVILNSTGEDITYSIDNGNSGRILQPGFHFFGFNNAVYSNTVSIEQLGIKTEDSLANEVRDKLVNITTSLNENISVEKSINELDNEIKSIGSIKAYTSTYGIENNKLIELKKEREDVLSFKYNYEELLAQHAFIQSEISDYSLKVTNLNCKILNARLIKKRYILIEAKEISEKIADLKDKLDHNKIYNSISMEDYSLSIEINKDIDYLKKRINSLNNSINDLDVLIEGLGKADENKGESDKEIVLDYNTFEELESENIQLLRNQDTNKLEFLNRDYKNNSSLKKGLITLLGFSALLFIIVLIYSGINNKPSYLIFNILMVLFIIFLIVKYRRTNGLLNRIEFQRTELDKLFQSSKFKINENENMKNDILKKYNVENKLEFKRLQENINFQMYKRNESAIELNKTIEKSIILQEELDEAKIHLSNNTIQLKELLEKNMSTSIQEFKVGLANKQIYEDLLVDIKNKEDLYKRILGNSKMEDIEDELEEFGDYLSLVESSPIEELEANMILLKEELSAKRISKKGLESELDYHNQKISNLVNIEEEIIRTILNLENMDNKKEALELAKNTIESLSKDIHQQFAPSINRRVGKIVEQITDGKYKTVKIDNKLGMSVINPLTEQNINVNNLSGGTIDQLYFALRFEIINSMADSSLPLILDDCFIQYDDTRLKNILSFLKEKSKERQIILFTCQKREAEILNKIDAEYNLIVL